MSEWPDKKRGGLDASEKTSASQRTTPAFWSRPIASNTTPARIGSQMARFRKIILVLRRR